MSYAVEIRVVNDPKFYPNAIRLATRVEADAYGYYKICTWTATEEYRVIESSDPVNYQWISGQGLVAVAETKSNEVTPP